VFLNWVMLAGLGGAAVPLVLHMLSRARYRNVAWGAMMFLEGREARQRQSARVRQAVLLGLRMLVVALLAVGLARPIMGGAWGTPGQGGPATVVILLDASGSMALEEAGRARFETARAAVLQILVGMRAGDRAALVVLGPGAAQGVDVPFPEPTSDRAALEAFVRDLKEPAGVADVARGLDRAAALLARVDGETHEVYVVADRQAVAWQGVTAAFAARWRERTRAAAPQVIAVPVGGDEADNVGIDAVRVMNPPVVRDVPAEVEVKLHNYGRRRASVPLAISLARHAGEEGKVARRLTATVLAGETLDVRTTLTFPEPHSHVISARIEGTGLATDDRVDYAVDVSERPKVLILSGDERDPPGSLRNEATYLAAALAPFGGGKGDLAAVTTRNADDWPTSLRGNAVVVLANVPQVTPAQARSLEQFVFEGGGLLISPGSLTRSENYNALLYRDGQGVAPAHLDRAEGVEEAAGAPVAVAPDMARHAVLRFVPFADAGVTVAQYFPAVPRAGAAILATYARSAPAEPDAPPAPFLIEGTFGRGRALLVTTPLDAEWSNLPWTAAYLPLVQSMARHLATGAAAPRNLAPGEPLVAALEDVDEKRIELLTPAGRADAAALQLTNLGGRRWQVRFADTRTPGAYRLRASGGDERAALFIVHAPRAESDLTPVDPARWAEIRRGLNFVQIDAARDVRAAVTHARTGRELWRECIGLVVILAVLETYLAARWQPTSS